MAGPERRIATIGDYADGGYGISVWCEKCQRGGLLTMEPFIAKHGRDWPAIFQGLVVCSKCGNKDLEFRIQPSATPF